MGGPRGVLPPASGGRRDTPNQVRSAEVSGLPNYAFDRRWSRAALLCVLLATLARLWLLGSAKTGLGALSLWLFPHKLAPALHDLCLQLGHVRHAAPLRPGPNQIAAHFCTLAASAGTLLCGYVLARRLFSPLTGLLIVAMLCATPFMLMGSPCTAWDPLPALFWSLAVVWLERALFAERRAEQNRAWTFVGVAAAFGCLATPAVLLLIPCLVLFMLLSPSHRAWLRRPGSWLAFLALPLLAACVIWWIARNRGAHFGHLPIPVASAPLTPFLRLTDRIAVPFLLAGPVLFVGATAAALKSLTLDVGTAGGLRCRFLACMSLPVWVLYSLASLLPTVLVACPLFALMPMTLLWAGWLTATAGRSRPAAIMSFSLAALAVATGLLLALTAPD